jgi:hypothetical protein
MGHMGGYGGPSYGPRGPMEYAPPSGPGRCEQCGHGGYSSGVRRASPSAAQYARRVSSPSSPSAVSHRGRVVRPAEMDPELEQAAQPKRIVTR